MIYHGDNIEVLRDLGENSVDAVVTDPPYGLSFMGKKWDYDVPSVELWREVLRVLKPGGHLLAFAGTRTQHRMAINIEDAGFEIRDMLAWVYGCLDEQTELATESGVKPYHKAIEGERVLCYDPDRAEYSYQPILEIVEYEYNDTAYRLVSDYGEQVVSRNHRCIVERGGRETFQLAETLEREASVPFLENLRELQQALSDAQPNASSKKQDLRGGVRESNDRSSQLGNDEAGRSQGANPDMFSLSNRVLEAERLDQEGEDTCLLKGMQRSLEGCGVEDTRPQRTGKLERGVRTGFGREDDGRDESSLERRGDISKAQGELCLPADKVRSLFGRVSGDGAERRICDGTPLDSGASSGSSAVEVGGGSPHQSRRNRQPDHKSNVVRDKRAAQTIRGWEGHKASVVRVVPFHYAGKVWCVRVPTGAFVAVRNGIAFPTGNSGFPKSHNISKAIDKMLGAEREVVGRSENQVGVGWVENKQAGFKPAWDVTAPGSPEAQAWEGFGTALKPALEPITLARKPIPGTIAECVLEHGTGAINIDGCRVGTEKLPATLRGVSQVTDFASGGITPARRGRWPANLIHDGSDEVVRLFPETGRASVRKSIDIDKPAATWSLNRSGSTERGHDDSGGSAARYFYCAKAQPGERNAGLEHFATVHHSEITNRKPGNAGTDHPRSGATSPRKNIHPTVKPIALMRYLVRLVTPLGGIVLDPYLGSGTTGIAAKMEGFDFIGMEREAEYVEIAKARIDYWTNQKEQVNDTKKDVLPAQLQLFKEMA